MPQVFLRRAQALIHVSKHSRLTRHFWFKNDLLKSPIFQSKNYLNVGARELAQMSMVFKENYLFFKKYHGIVVQYSSDTNGSGNQSCKFEVLDESGGLIFKCNMNFMPTEKCEFIYEADLFTDQRKDYDPVINRGRRRFDVENLELTFYGKRTMCDWVAEAYPIVKEHAELLGPVRADLISWTEVGLDMTVTCPNYPCRHISIIPNSNLMSYRSDGEVLASLRKKLTCWKCGYRAGVAGIVPKLSPTIPNPTKTIRRPAWRDI